MQGQHELPWSFACPPCGFASPSESSKDDGGGRGVVFLHIQCRTGEDLGVDLVQERGELVSHQVRVGHGS